MKSWWTRKRQHVYGFKSQETSTFKKVDSIEHKIIQINRKTCWPETREANCKSDGVKVKQSEQFVSTAVHEETGNVVCVGFRKCVWKQSNNVRTNTGLIMIRGSREAECLPRQLSNQRLDQRNCLLQSISATAGSILSVVLEGCPVHFNTQRAVKWNWQGK